MIGQIEQLRLINSVNYPFGKVVENGHCRASNASIRLHGQASSID